MALRYLATRGDVKDVGECEETCIACGRRMISVTYQARSADEPARHVRTCTLCPLNPSKLSPKSLTLVPDYGSSRPNSRRRRNAGCSVAAEFIDSYWEVRASFEVSFTELADGVTCSMETSKYKSVTCSTQTEGVRALVSCLVNISTSICHTPVEKFEVCPGVTLARMGRHRVGAIPEDSVTYSVLSCKDVNLKSIVVDAEAETPNACSVSMKVLGKKDPGIISFIRTVYNAGLCPDRLDKCWKYGGVRSLLCLKPRAHDAGRAEDTEHVFTTKPDGQRCLVARLGSVWGYFTSDTEARLIGWSLPDAALEPLAEPHVGAVLDAEMIVGRKPLFIDMLQQDDGAPAPTKRTILDAVALAKKLPLVEFGVSFRDYFSASKEAEVYASRVEYPCDGLVAISVNGVEMKKLKNHRSVELTHVGGGKMASHEGVVVLLHETLSKFETNSVVELRFTAEARKTSGRGTMVISCKDAFERTDKTKANSTEACAEIFRVAAGMISGPTMARRLSMLWCNTIKSRMVKQAVWACQRRRVILDVGSGDGQSLGSYYEALGQPWSKSVAFIEVDHVRARSLARSLIAVRSKLVNGLEELLKSMSRLRNGDLDAVVCVADANEIGKHMDLLQEIKRTVGSVVSNFSASHVLPCVETLLLTDLKVFGCAYMYDAALPDGTLVDTGDIVMRKVTDDEATVKWGGDKVYKEKPLHKSDLECYCSVRNALSIVPLSAEAASSEVVSKCRHVCEKVHVFYSV